MTDELSTNAFGSPVTEPAAKQLSDMTLEEKFELAKAEGMANAQDKFGELFAQQVVPENSIADQLSASQNSKITVHQDGSITTQKGVLGNDRDSAELIKILREQAYQRHNIND